MNDLEVYERGSFLHVCGGLAWPTVEAPAYFCVFGQKTVENKFGKKPLVQLSELEDCEESIDSFFKRVVDIVKSFNVDLIYGDSENDSFYEKAKSFDLYMPQKLTGMHDFIYGLNIVKMWSKADAIKTMENSIIRSQLSSLRETDLKEAPEKYNAINGLRYVVTGFDDRDDGRPLSDKALRGLDADSMCA